MLRPWWSDAWDGRGGAGASGLLAAQQSSSALPGGAEVAAEEF